MTANFDPTIQDPRSALFRLRRELRIERRESRGAAYFLIEDPVRAKFYRVGEAEHTLIALLDGTRTLEKAVQDAASQLRERAFSEAEALSICAWLAKSQLVERADASEEGRPPHNASERRSWWSRWRNPISIRVPMCNPTTYLDAIEPWLAWSLRRPFFLIWLATCLYALFLAGTNWTDLTSGVAVLLDRQHWWLLVASWLALKLLHETYHALVCRKYGGSVGEAGLFLLFFAPVPYVEVSSCWRFSSKWQRIATAAAGIYIELFVAALAVIAWTHSAGAGKHVAASIALLGSLGTLAVNANPLMRFDGYFILSDWLEIPNLHSYGRRWIGSLVSRWLGCTPAPLGLPARAATVVKVYSVAALVWRLIVWFTLTLAIVVLLGRVHTIVAAVGGALIVGAAAYRGWQTVARFLESHGDLSRRRLYGAAAVGLALLLLAAYRLLGPSTVVVPGVVEYRPLVVVRAATPGFVREVQVQDGDTVAGGQPLLVLHNDDLALEHRIAELNIEKSIAKCRLLRGAGEIAKEQAELAEQTALRKKRDELESQIRALTVLAPSTGKILSRNLNAWQGRYVETGTELLMIGDEESKEIVVAVAQDDVELFQSRPAAPLSVRVAGFGAPTFEATGISLEPRATTSAPHEALSSRLEGPLTVRVNSDPTDPQKSNDELLEPCFKASVPLSAEQSRLLFAGQLASVEFRSAEQTFAHRAATLISRWFRQAVDQ